MMKRSVLILLLSGSLIARAQTPADIDRYNVVWNSQSQNSSESMPCGGGDIGLNVWVENGDILCYIARSGTFDENNAMLKPGRLRIKLTPNPFAQGGIFKQQLVLQNGSVIINGGQGALSAQVKIWVDVFRPVIHVAIQSNKAVKTEAAFESWRYQDRRVNGNENNQGSWKFGPQGTIITRKDQVDFSDNDILFYHHNPDSTVFDVTVKQQGMDAVKQQMFNPLKNLTFGGLMRGKNLKPAGTYTGKYINTDFKGWKLQSVSPARSQDIAIYLNTAQTASVSEWRSGLNKLIADAQANQKTAWQNTAQWWQKYWGHSFIYIGGSQPANTPEWQSGKNYQLFHYMLGCNAFGQYPTKFNGGLFTYDPVFVKKDYNYTPDFRNWGGGLMTAQNQRLVYYPMLKGGDFDMMKPQFDFYLRSLHNAELRSQVYWGHNGACFTEQLENFGLPNLAEYGWKRPDGFDKGVEYNAWLEYTWDTVFEFCQMMLETERYAGKDIHQYIPFIESCLTFFDEHYQYLARNRGSKALDAGGHLILYPGSGAETFKMAYNANSTIGALQTVTQRLLALPSGYLNAAERTKLEGFLKRIPPITTGQINGHEVLTPAKSWERVNNEENIQFYTVFPWPIYGLDKPRLDIPLNSWKYDTLAAKFRSGVGWKQDNIFAARLGLTNEAAGLTTFKLKDSGRRFPAFWGPGFDWTPDHNWGGSGMIGLQEMLMQVDDRKIMLFPAWPKNWDVHFKLYAPYQTTVEGVLKNGQISLLKVTPQERMKDVVMMLK